MDQLTVGSNMISNIYIYIIGIGSMGHSFIQVAMNNIGGDFR
jgi:hypothetical protein